MNHPKPEKLKDKHVTANVSIRHLYCGAVLQIPYEIQVVGLDGRTVKQQT